ncbi:hypothetical protein CTEN210_06940 [Chaetoceros tenuissimus]|uniref:Uncharacterized protein n=1 Tax=Chaetoceros tenuissimus TaxID=426638 RepID=A0AAD3H5A8_9STRA|nr:hypothetical protein CTEN210_06940 [Chaetoceros tenuissimus]
MYEATAPRLAQESYLNRSRPNETAIKAWQTCLQGAFITGDRQVLPSLHPIPSATPANQEQQPSSISAHLSSQPSSIQDVIGPMHELWPQEDIDCIRGCLEDGQDIEIYGDGTVSKGKGAHYYSIKPAICENPKYLCLHGGMKTSSNRSGIVSLRPESFSIVAALSVIQAVLSVYNITSSDSRLKIPVHVKSHQDDKIPYEELPYEAQMNVEMDRMADAVRDSPAPIPPVPDMIDHDFTIRIKGEVVYSNVSSALRSEITGRAMKAYLKSKYQWTDVIFEKIDWNSLEAYMKSLSQQIRTNVHKLHNGWQFTRQRRNIFELQGKEDFELKDESCPLGCRDTDETHHFLSCSSKPGFLKSNTELRRLDRFLQRYKTPQPLC